MECLELMALDFKSHIFQSFAQIPSYSAWLVEKADLTSTYAYQRRVMKLLQWREPTRPWRLKSPSHVLFLEYLDRVFPDARFVMTHRDPTDVILSVADLYADIIGGFTDHIDRRYIGQLNVEHWSLGMERVRRFRDGAADDRFYDIDFPRDAGRSDHAGAGPLRMAWRTVDRRTSRPGCAAGGPRPPTSASRARTRTRRRSALDLDQVRPLFADYVASAQRWSNH